MELPMALPQVQMMVASVRKNLVWVLGILVLATGVFAGLMYTQKRHDDALSAQFRGSAQQAYRVITICEAYKNKRKDAYVVRELDAEKAVAATSATAKTLADRL